MDQECYHLFSVNFRPLFDDDSDDDMFGSKTDKKSDKKKPVEKKPAEKKPDPKKAEATKGASKGSSDSDDVGLALCQRSFFIIRVPKFKSW